MPLRDLMIAGLLAITLPLVFRHVYVGVLLWTWISMMSPHKLTYGFMHSAPIAAVVGAATLVGLLTTRDRVKFMFPPPLLFAALFLTWTCITTAFAFFPADSMGDLDRFFKIVLMVLVSAAVLHTREHIRLFIWVVVLSLGLYGVKGGIYTILTGGSGRVWGPPGGFIEGNNELALALIVTVPLMNFLRLTSPYKLVRQGLVAMMGLSIISAAGSQSRGAFLAMTAMAFVLWWRSPRKLPGAIVGVVGAFALLAFMPQSWHERMDTIQTYQEDGSAMGRIHAWQTAINVANDRVVGAGYSMYVPFVFAIYSPKDSDSKFDAGIARAAHSIYFQVLGEHGYIGLFLFLMVWLTGWRAAARLRKNSRDKPDIAWLFQLGGMTQVSLVGFAVGGAFLSLAYFDLPYNVVLAVVLAQRWRAERATLAEKPVEPLPVKVRPTFARRLVYWIRTA